MLKTIKGTPLRHNAGDEAAYIKALTSITMQMVSQTRREIIALYRSPDFINLVVGMDDSPQYQLRKLTKNLENKFVGMFEKRATGMAEAAINRANKTSSASLYEEAIKANKIERAKALKEVSLKGSIINKKNEEFAKIAIKENVSLIKSIPLKHLERVEKMVTESITTGKGLKDLIKNLSEIGDISYRRSKMIALDQTRKIYNNVNANNMLGLGIKSFEWLHSGGSAHPRELHMVLDGQVFEINDPPIINVETGVRGLPGDEINCRCTMSPVFEFQKDTE